MKEADKALVDACRRKCAEYQGKVDRLETENEALKDNAGELAHQVKNAEGELVQVKANDLVSRVERLASRWVREGPSRDERAVLYFDDPVCGQFCLDERLSPVLVHPLFQRLNYVRQLSFAYLVFASASHTRLSHCLGVARNAKVAMQTIFEKGWLFSSQGKRKIDRTPDQWDALCLKAQLCGLLHDIGHGPFGHALDKLIPYMDPVTKLDLPDRVYSIKYIKGPLAEAVKRVAKEGGFTLEEVTAILDREEQANLSGYDGLIAGIIASQLDVDGMDFLARDAHMTGLRMGRSNVEALMEHMCPFDDGQKISLTYEESALPHIENYMYAHDIMYMNCYEHPRKVAAERLLIRLCQHLLNNGVSKDDLMLLADEQLFTVLDWFLPASGALRQSLRALQQNLEFRLPGGYPKVEESDEKGENVVRRRCEYGLSKWDPTQRMTVFNDALSDDVKGWQSRRGVYEKHQKSVYVDDPNKWEELVWRSAELQEGDRWRAVVTVPAPNVRKQEESETQILVKTGRESYDTVGLAAASKLMNAVVMNVNPLREVIRVLVSADTPDELSGRIADEADKVFLRPQSG